MPYTPYPIPHSLSSADPSTPYWYEGQCPYTGEWLRLPRTPQVETLAKSLMQQLGDDQECDRDGKMYGVLLVATANGEQQVLKAFSGLLHGQREVAGWVPPIPGRERVAWEEANTLTQLEAMKQQLIALQNLPARSQLAAQIQMFASQRQQLATEHAHRKQQRQQQRQILQQTLTSAVLTDALEQLDEQSRQDGIQRRRLKRQQDEQLQPLKRQVEQADAQMRELKQQRKHLSQQLQTQMHRAYQLTNFAGNSLPLQTLMPSGSMPTGTGECCAPKLLHYAATHSLRPLAMAEFWWGKASANQDKVSGEFYGACAERCQPLMGFLLSGLSTAVLAFNHWTVPILYQDEWLIAVDKPAGLLSVPGRYRDRQDSVQSRLRSLFPNENVVAIHRLDHETSGILLVARDAQTQRHLSQQFQQRRVDKVYEAVLAGRVMVNESVIELPLWGNPSDRPRQTVDWQQGKSAVTKFRVLANTSDFTRVEFSPITGRTHQLRVHAADSAGLGIPILGDRLYGCQANAQRLHLHAREITIQHPHTQQPLHLQSTTPF
ncbi:MAG: RluA family pseudouridine synthase [Oscillatoriales cyanobacterium C42_A2020_001]|nr:RluA family pseudouridine synthase [Leptolyngbyaceae cyanobacterium C42_A2020_001]